jgi:hypothetical protein
MTDKKAPMYRVLVVVEESTTETRSSWVGVARTPLAYTADGKIAQTVYERVVRLSFSDLTPREEVTP